MTVDAIHDSDIKWDVTNPTWTELQVVQEDHGWRCLQCRVSQLEPRVKALQTSLTNKLVPLLRLLCGQPSAASARSPRFKRESKGVVLLSGLVSWKRTTEALQYTFSRGVRRVDQ